MDPQLLEEVTEFLRERVSVYLSWDDAILRNAVQWHERVAALGVVRLKGRVAAVGLARVVRRNGTRKRRWENDEDLGDVLWVDEVAAEHAALVPLLWQQAVARFGPRKWAGGRRHGRETYWPFRRFERRIRTLT